MFQIHTSKDSESVREALRRLIASHDRASGHIDGDTFRLRPKPGRRGVAVTLHGRILPDRGGSLVSVWSLPHWVIIIWFPVWAWFCLRLVHAPIWFLVLGFLGGIVSFIVETRRGYDLLRDNVA